MKKIQSVHRAAQILDLFYPNKPQLGISEISRLLGLSKGTVQGLVRTLLDDGFLNQDPETRKYQLGLKLYELGVVVAASMKINQMASGPAHELSKKTQLLVHIATFDDNSAIITLDAYPRSEPFLSRYISPRFPLYCTACGKAILAFWEKEKLDAYFEQAEFISYTSNTIIKKDQLLRELEKTRQRGYSINREEHLLARSAIGAPIFEREGSVMASLAVAGDTSRIVGESMENLASEVVNAASEVSRNMGYYRELFTSEKIRKAR